MNLNTYKVFIDEDLDRAINKRLPKELHKAFEEKLKSFQESPFHPSNNTKKIVVSQRLLKQLQVDDVYTFRISQSYRCLFHVIHPKSENEQGKIIIADVGDHDYMKRQFKR